MRSARYALTYHDHKIMAGKLIMISQNRRFLGSLISFIFSQQLLGNGRHSLETLEFYVVKVLSWLIR